MSTGLYIHRLRRAGEIVDAPMYNGAHQNQLNNDIPVSAGGESDTLGQFRATEDPTTGDGVTALPAAAVADEILQLRFVIADIKMMLNGNVAPPFWYSAITPTATQVQAHGARVFRNTTQSIPFKTVTPCIFNTVRYDTGVLLPTFDPFFVVGTPTRLTAIKAGLYHITGNVEWNTGVTSGDLAVFIRRNGTQLIGAAEQAVDGTAAFRFQIASAQYFLNQGDYVELCVFQTQFNPNFNIINPEFSLELLNINGVVAPPTIFVLAVSTAGTGTGTVAWTPTMTGSVSPENYVAGTVVTLTATPNAPASEFAGWTGDVPVGHENDNPLTVTMDQTRSLVATFNLVQVTQVQFPHAGTSAGAPYSTTNKFGILAEDSDVAVTGSTVGNFQFRAPIAFDITRIDVESTTAPGTGKSITFKINVNGVTNNTISVTISDLATTATSTGGPLSIAQDDLICIEASAFGGGLTTLTIDHFAIAMRTPLI